MTRMMRMRMITTMMQNESTWCKCIWSWSVGTQPARPGVCHRQREGPVMLQIPVKFVLPQERNLPLYKVIDLNMNQWTLNNYMIYHDVCYVTYSNKKWRQMSKFARGKTHTLSSWTIRPKISQPVASNSPPQMLSPPVPSPCGSPVWIMKPWPDHALWTLQVFVHRNQLHTEKARGNRTKLMMLMALDFGNKLSANWVNRGEWTCFANWV